MKFINLIVIFLLACGDIKKEKIHKEVNYCEEARKYIGDCIDATLPKLDSCDEEFAKSVLNQNCDSVVEYVFN